MLWSNTIAIRSAQFLREELRQSEKHWAQAREDDRTPGKGWSKPTEYEGFGPDPADWWKN